MSVAKKAKTEVEWVECGSLSSGAILKTKQVFTWGYAGNGRLGLEGMGEKRGMVKLPVEVPGLKPAKLKAKENRSDPLPAPGAVEKFLLGGGHGGVITTGGDVLLWGRNTEGQLGRGHCEEKRKESEMGTERTPEPFARYNMRKPFTGDLLKPLTVICKMENHPEFNQEVEFSALPNDDNDVLPMFPRIRIIRLKEFRANLIPTWRVG